MKSVFLIYFDFDWFNYIFLIRKFWCNLLINWLTRLLPIFWIWLLSWLQDNLLDHTVSNGDSYLMQSRFKVEYKNRHIFLETKRSGDNFIVLAMLIDFQKFHFTKTLLYGGGFIVIWASFTTSLYDGGRSSIKL